MNYLRYLIIGGLILNTMGYGKSFLWGSVPTGVPPPAQVAFGLFMISTHMGDSDYEKNVRREAWDKTVQAAKTFIPGYLTAKDLNALFTGENNLAEWLLYRKKEDDFKI